MKQINNGYCKEYYLTEDGMLYNTSTKALKGANRQNNFFIKREDGTIRKISLKRLYRLVYEKPYCIDNIKDIDNEIWEIVENTNGNYYISNRGRVKSYTAYNAILLKPMRTENGYLRVEIVQNERRAIKLIHRLVAAAFLPKPQSIEMQLHHKDGNKENNEYNNLQWVTPTEHRMIHNERRNKENASK